MISVLPGQTFEFRNPNDKASLDRIKSEVIRALNGASPFVNTIEFLNKTKHCTVDILFNEGKMQILFKNPADEAFDLNEMENPVTVSDIDGERIG